MNKFVLSAIVGSAMAISASTASAANLTWADITEGVPTSTLGPSGASTYSFTYDLGATGIIAASITTSSAHAGSVIISSNGESSQVQQHTSLAFPAAPTDNSVTHTTGELVRFSAPAARDNATITFDFSDYNGILEELVLAVDHVAGRDRLSGNGRTTLNFSQAFHLAADLQSRASDTSGNAVPVGTVASAFEARQGAGGDGDFLFNGITGSFNLNLDRGQGDTVYIGFADQGNANPVNSPALMSLLLIGMGGMVMARIRNRRT